MTGETALINGEHDPDRGGCERIEVTVPLWLTIHDEGGITVYGIGRDDARFYCGNDHDVEPDEDRLATLDAFLCDMEVLLGAESPEHGHVGRHDHDETGEVR